MNFKLNKDNLYINFDKFESEESNICLITGLSGSGKSTLGEKIARDYKAEYIELDLFEHCSMFQNDEQLKQAGDVFYEYFNKHKDIYKKIKLKKISDKELSTEISKFLKYTISYCKNNKDKKFIIEGVQIYSFGDESLKKYPIIFVQASILKSIKQRWIRNGNGKIDWKEELKTLPPLLRWYLGEEREYNKFKKSILKESDNMEFEGLNEEINTLPNNYNTNEESKDKNIVKGKSINELNESLFEFLKLPYNEQVELDRLCIEEYGETNHDRYNRIYNELSSRVYLNNSINESVSSYDYVNKVDNVTPFINKISGSLPYFTVSDMEDLGVYSNSNYYNEPTDLDNVDIEWYNNYKLISSGIIPQNFEEVAKRRLNKLDKVYRNVYENGMDNKSKQSILELGWDPEVAYTPENVANRSKDISLQLRHKFESVQVFDATNINEDIIIESTVKDKNPIYVVLVYTASPFGKLIKKYTHGEYTHAAIGLDVNLDKLYSFNLANNFNKLGGFSIESIKGYIKDNKDAVMAVYTSFINDEKFKKLKKQLEYLRDNVDKTRYSFINILSLLANKPVELANDMICSQFVDRMLKLVDIDITGVSSSLVTPNDIYNSAVNKIYKLYEGRVDKYNQRKADSTINKLKKSHITEASTPIQFDDNGDLLIIKNIKDIEEEFNKSHKLLMSYNKTNNYEAMKYELYKLWYMNLLLERKIFKEKKPLKEYHDMRARILNDFNKYLKIVNKNDPEYIFSQEYENSKYNDNIYKIHNSTLKYGIQYAKSLTNLFL